MKRNIIRQIYFYAASLITLIIMVVATAQILNIGLKTYIFPMADDAYRTTCDDSGNRVGMYDVGPVPVEKTTVATTPDGATAEQTPTLTDEEKAANKAKCEQAVENERTAERQRDLVNNLSMLLVSAPVFWFHFRIAQREREEEKNGLKEQA